MEKLEETPWTVLSSEYLYRKPWLTARKDHVLLPNGNHIPEYYVLEYPDWVNVIAITDKGEFILIRQYRHGIGKTAYELCAGVCEPEDPSPLVSAQRELLEETGYGKGTWSELMVTSPNSSTCTNFCHSFLAVGVEKVSEQHLEDTECLTVHLKSFEEVRALLEEGAFLQAMMLAPLWKFFSTHNAPDGARDENHRRDRNA